MQKNNKFQYLYLSNAFSILSFILLALNPYFSYRSAGAPDSGNTSLTPILSNLHGIPDSARTSAMLEPSPPIIEWSSTVNTFLIPLLLAIGINQTFLSDKGADALARAATISAGTNDGSVNQRLRYYEDVLTHMSSNSIFGVGLGNWKLKSIDYDAKDISGYIVPYHAHSDFIQLGAELGIIGFLLYLAVFLWAIYYVYRLIRFSSISIEEKVFLFLMLIALGVYSVDANLNFPIARPQVLVVWTMIMAMINFYYQKHCH